MINVTIQCRECPPDSPTLSYTSQFEPNEGTDIADTQYHTDTQFVARCDGCFACNWEVIKVEDISFHGVSHAVQSNYSL